MSETIEILRKHYPDLKYTFSFTTEYERWESKDPDHWKGKLKEGIEILAEWSRVSGKPVITTECWGIVDYKDWPLLNWDWIKELCAYGTGV